MDLKIEYFNQKLSELSDFLTGRLFSPSGSRDKLYVGSSPSASQLRGLQLIYSPAPVCTTDLQFLGKFQSAVVGYIIGAPGIAPLSENCTTNFGIFYFVGISPIQVFM